MSKVFIFSAPSGSGKSTIVHWLMEEHPELKLTFSVSATSRAPRGEEKDGVDYHFLSVDEFRQKIADNEFLEYEEVYKDCFYGTLKAQVEEKLNAGYNVLFDVDVKGGLNIKKFYGDQAMSFFIQPPSIEELRKRLIHRATDSMEKIQERVTKAEYEMTFAPKFDRLVVNNDLNQAEAETLAHIQEFLK